MLKVSVIIATFNRCYVLDETLSRFTSVNFNKSDWELIVVDNNSNDCTASIVKKYKNKLPIIYLFEKNQGKNFALNSALKIVAGELIVFTDDDIDPDPSWLNIIVESTDRWPNIRVFGGKVEPVFPYKVNSKIIESEFSSYVFGKYEPYVNEKVCVDTTPVGANCWFRKSIFDDGYVYDPTIGPSGRGRVSGSEMEFFTRLVASGEKIVYVPDALVYHRIQESQLTLKYLLRRSYASGRGWVRVKGREENIVLWFGAPRYMYRIICEKLIEAFAFFLSKKNYLEPLMTISGYLGCIKEYRAGRPAKPEKGE